MPIRRSHIIFFIAQILGLANVGFRVKQWTVADGNVAECRTVQHAILYGEHELMLDEKNRLLVPSEIRKSLVPERDGEAFFLVVGQNRKPWLYTEKYYEHLVSSGEQQLMPNENVLAFNQYFFAMASRAECDKAGRILIPEKTLQRTGTKREVTLIGARDHLEIWNRTDWEHRFEELFSRSEAVIARAQLAAAQQALLGEQGGQGV
jgi:MraZ protein